MNKTFFLWVLPLFISCSGQDCTELPGKFDNYEEAIKQVLNAEFAIEQEADVRESSFIESAEYFNCGGSTGFLIMNMSDKDYLFQGVPISTWEEFKKAESKGGYFHQVLKGRFKVNLNNVSNEVLF